MPESLKPQTRQQMCELCNKISVAHDLDESIQEELLGHMEDKLLAYLSGDEPVSEQDAFILVREHFGDPATIKTLMQDAHPGPVRASLARRLGAVLIASMAVQLGIGWVHELIDGLLSGSPIEANGWFVCTVEITRLCAGLIVLWLLLRHWQRALTQGGKPWFLKARPRLFIYLTILLLTLRIMFSTELVKLYFPLVPPPYMPPQWFEYARWYLGTTLSCLIWLWWCDRPPRRALALTAAAGVWVTAYVLRVAAGGIGTLITLVTTDVGGEPTLHKAGLMAASMPRNFVTVLLRTDYQIMTSAAAAIVLYLVITLARRSTKIRPLTN